jgi:hypothetical protein
LNSGYGSKQEVERLATYHAIAATGQAILSLLSSECPKPEFAGAQFELYQAKDLLTPGMELGVSLYLYRVAVNGNIRNTPPRLGPDGRRYRPSLPLDLYYLLTAWAKTAVKQQRLLGWAMRALENRSILPQGLLNYSAPEAEVFGPSETVEIIFEPLSVQDMVSVWEVAKANQQPSATFVARMVTIDSQVELVEARLVQTRAIELTKGPGA